MRVIWIAAFVLSACQPQATNTQNEAAPDLNTATAPPPQNTQNLVREVDTARFEADRAKQEQEEQYLRGLSPRQRQAYRKGVEDCLAGRYEPDPWPEAYRIGCAAANDR
jgi:ABC-type transporter MlaC component